MKSTQQKLAFVAGKPTPKGTTVVYWIVTVLFCLEMSLTAYYMLMRLPEGAQAITRLGFPGYFRMELASAKLIRPIDPGAFDVPPTFETLPDGRLQIGIQTAAASKDPDAPPDAFFSILTPDR